MVADVQGLQPGGADRDPPPVVAGAEGGEAGLAIVAVEETREEDVQPQDRLPRDLPGHPRPVHLGPRPLGPRRDRRDPGPEITRKVGASIKSRRHGKRFVVNYLLSTIKYKNITE